MKFVDIFNYRIIFKKEAVASALNSIPLALSGSYAGVDRCKFTREKKLTVEYLSIIVCFLIILKSNELPLMTY